MIPARLRLLVWCALVLVAVALGYAAWIWRPTKAPPDMIAVLRANNRGVGHMERFEDTEYPAAEAAFREAVSLAPDWLPGQINLGISLLNQHERPAKIDEAAALFEKVLKKPNGKHHFPVPVLDRRHMVAGEEQDCAGGQVVVTHY